MSAVLGLKTTSMEAGIQATQVVWVIQIWHQHLMGLGVALDQAIGTVLVGANQGRSWSGESVMGDEKGSGKGSIEKVVCREILVLACALAVVMISSYWMGLGGRN